MPVQALQVLLSFRARREPVAGIMPHQLRVDEGNMLRAGFSSMHGNR